MSRAAFLDRDGTLIEDVGFLADPAGIRIIAGVIPALARLREAGVAAVIVTNQSGIARGLIAWDRYQAVAEALEHQLAEAGVPVDATYVCPHYPPLTGPCDCRKPALGNYRLAAERHGIDLTRSLFVGDRLTDVEPARAAGGIGLLVETGEGRHHAAEARARGFEVVSDLGAAVERFLAAGPA